MTKKTNKDLLAASEKLIAMAAKRRKRQEATVAASTKKAPAKKAKTAAAAKKPAKKVKAEPEFEAALPELPVEEVLQVAPEVAEDEVLPAAPAVATAAAKKVAADKVQAADPKNGGFEGAALTKVKDTSSDLGEVDYGYAVPPELEKAVEDGKAEDSDDESYTPGVLIPPELADAVMAFVDPASLPADQAVDFDMIPFMPEGATTAAEVLNAGAHWVLCANGDPLAKIVLKDQDNADKIAAHFASADYAKSVIEGIQKYGLQATVEYTKAKPYVAKIDENKKVSEIRARLEQESKAALRKTIADVKSRYVENLDLVLTASSNNFIVENPLKDALVSFMTSAGVPEVVAAQGVDQAFFQKGVQTVAGLLDKAEEWSNYSPEAIAEVKATVEQAGRRARPLPSQLSPAQANPDYDQGMANRMAARAIPVQTTPAKQEVSVAAHVGNPEPADAADKNTWRARYGRFGS